MKYGTIAGGEKSTVHAASVILENGGNAFDAAVGAVFTSMVSEYNLTGAGGGGAYHHQLPNNFAAGSGYAWDLRTPSTP